MLRILLLAFCVTFLGSCSPEPDYPVDRMGFEEALLGEWVSAPDPNNKNAEPIRLTFIRRDIPAGKNRLNESGGEANAPGYTIRMAGSAGDDQPLNMEFVGFLVKGEKVDYLGVQISNERLDKAGGLGWVLPVHRMFAIRLDGDGFTIWIARNEVAWVPGVDWLDGPSATPSPIGQSFQRERGDGKLLITSSIDRLIAEYDANPEIPARDSKDAIRFQRP